MKVYKMELAKILRRKSTWALAGLLIAFIMISLIREANQIQMILVDFGKIAGYKRFLSLLEIFIACAIVGEVVILSSFFCEDKQYGVDVLIFTTAKGKLHDFISRVQVTFTIIISVHTMMILGALIIGSIFYGYPNNNFPMREMAISNALVTDKSFIVYIVMYLFNLFNASVLVVSLIACISTMCSNSINSVIIAVAILMMPPLLEDIFRNGEMNVGYVIITAQPLMLGVTRILVESWSVYGLHVFIVYFISIIALIIGAAKWCSVSKR